MLKRFLIIGSILSVVVAGFALVRSASARHAPAVDAEAPGAGPDVPTPIPLESAGGSDLFDGPPEGRGLRVPILMYHQVGEPTSQYVRLAVSVQRFEEQMRALSEAGVATLGMGDLYDAVTKGRSFPQGAVAITFDDGLESAYFAVFPVLQRYRLRATLYVPAGRVGGTGYLTWDQIREMRASGLVTIAAHTVDHVNLRSLSRDAAWRQIEGSREILEENLGAKVEHFAYPFGKTDERIEALVRDAGFLTATTTQGTLIHTAGRALRWGRMRVTESTSPAYLARLAQLGGAWVTGRPERLGGNGRRTHSPSPSPSPSGSGSETPSPEPTATATPTESASPEPSATESPNPVCTTLPPGSC